MVGFLWLCRRNLQQATTVYSSCLLCLKILIANIKISPFPPLRMQLISGNYNFR